MFIGEALRDAFDPEVVKRTVDMTNLIEIRDLSVAFSGQTVVRNPSWTSTRANAWRWWASRARANR